MNFPTDTIFLSPFNSILHSRRVLAIHFLVGAPYRLQKEPAVGIKQEIPDRHIFIVNKNVPYAKYSRRGEIPSAPG